MNQAKSQQFWSNGQGWMMSVTIGFIVIMLRFDALIPPAWQSLVKGGAIALVGLALAITAMRAGYRLTGQALMYNDYIEAAGGSPNSVGTILRVIVRTVVSINAPVWYWTAFLFVFLPFLAKMPNASLLSGSTMTAAMVLLAMAAAVIIGTHIGLVLIRYALRSVASTPELPQAPLSAQPPNAYSPYAGSPQAHPYAQPDSQSPYNSGSYPR